MKRVHAPRGKLNVEDKQETLILSRRMSNVEGYDSINVSSTWELTSVSMRYSQGDVVHTSLYWLVLYPRSFVVLVGYWCVCVDYPRHGHVLYGTIIIKTMCVHHLYLQG